MHAADAALVVRRQFVGEKVISRLTGGVTLHYPAWKRRLKKCVAVPVLSAQLLLLTGVITGLYALWMHIMEGESQTPHPVHDPHTVRLPSVHC